MTTVLGGLLGLAVHKLTQSKKGAIEEEKK
jgi:hypothetical protein